MYNLQSVFNLYQDLINAIALINSTFSFHLILIVMNSLMLTIFCSYALLREILSPSELIIYTFLLNGNWLIIQFLFQVIIAFAGSSVTVQAHETLSIVSEVLNSHELSADMNDKLQNFVTRINRESLQIQNVFFVIDWKFLITVKTKIHI
jgi:hypothetical protein